MTTIKIGLKLKLITSRLSGHLFTLWRNNLSKTYKSMAEYISALIHENKVQLDVKIIKDLLFIEKIRFLELEQKTTHDIFREILDNSDISTHLKSFNSKVVGAEIFPVISRFFYKVIDPKVLIYTFWRDKRGNIIVLSTGVDNTYKILEEGDTYVLK